MSPSAPSDPVSITRCADYARRRCRCAAGGVEGSPVKPEATPPPSFGRGSRWRHRPPRPCPGPGARPAPRDPPAPPRVAGAEVYSNAHFLKITLAAAAVVVVGVVGLTLMPRSSVPGVGAAPTSSPTAAPTMAPSASTIPSLPFPGVLEPGRYRIRNLSIEVPEGWGSLGSDILSKTQADGDAAALLAVWPISGTYVDPCTDHTLVEPSPGRASTSWPMRLRTSQGRRLGSRRRQRSTGIPPSGST